MEIKFSFFAYGILAIAALLLILTFSSAETGQGGWASSFFALATLIIVAFILYMFMKILRR